MTLAARSVAAILAAQADTGAIVAAPSFPPYRYCWFRDGSFSAFALDRRGEHDAAARFFAWGEAVIARHAPDLRARYAADGSAATEPWGDLQMDGYGAFVWALAHHLHVTGADPRPHAAAIDLVTRSLAARWDVPQFDVWEEAEGRYTATLAAIHGGLRAAEPYLAAAAAPSAHATAAAIRARILAEGVRGGRFTKTLGGAELDASLLGCVWPFEVVGARDPLALATVAAIERDLLRGGVHRYPTDTYYGGGEWVLLTAWLAIVLARQGRRADAEALRAWIEAHAEPDGALPEQVREDLVSPPSFDEWVGRWGPPASPLTWSHAMYLLLIDELARPI